MPKCELFWPEKQRNRAVEAGARILRQYGRRLRMSKVLDEEGYPLEERSVQTASQLSSVVHFEFPLRDRPATSEDVQAGEAIFSLVGQGDVRISQSPKLPRNARWTTLKDYPIVWPYWQEPEKPTVAGSADASHSAANTTEPAEVAGLPVVEWIAGKEGRKPVVYEQNGVIWQAEEVEVGGQWQRYYGFVGRYGLAKVPAEEIEFFPDAEEYISVNDHLQVTLNAAPGAEEKGYTVRCKGADYFPSMLFYHAGRPIVFKVQVFNRSGADRPLPPFAEDLAAKGPAGIPMSLELDFCPQIPTPEYIIGLSLGGDTNPQYNVARMPWTNMPLRANVQPLKGKKMERNLFPAEHADCLELDLKQRFDVSKTGTYRLKLKLACGPNGAWQENTAFFSVIDKSAP
jgi:hypothetical protein